VCLAIGINMPGEKKVLGRWIPDNEGAKFGYS